MLFRFLKRKYKYYQYEQKRDKNPLEEEIDIGLGLAGRIEKFKSIFGDSNDFKVHNMKLGNTEDNSIDAAIIFIDGLVDNKIINDSIIFPLLNFMDCGIDIKNKEELVVVNKEQLLIAIKNEVLTANETKIVEDVDEIISECLSGNTALLIDGVKQSIIINSKGFEKRAVTEPASESVLRGPREGFNENLRTNTSLIRRKIKSENLHVENLIVGRQTKTNVSLVYLKGIVNTKVLEEVRRRIKNLDVGSILESGYIEEYIEDAPYSPFATIAYSEKPDTVAANILEGRVAIIIDGTPFVLTAPMLFIEAFQSSEDYYGRAFYSSLVRLVRYLGYLIATFAPAVFIALTTFHQELIPTKLLVTIINAREGTAFPIVVEALIMLFAFEIMREAGIRLPRPVGQAISIVGALVMGDAAVSAGIVGAPIVITIAITAVASFLVPKMNESISIIRLILIALAAFAGLFGILLGVLLLLTHLSSLTSFGVPYFDAFAENTNDSLIRMPLWHMHRRPKDIAENNQVRQKSVTPKLRPYESNNQINRLGE